MSYRLALFDLDGTLCDDSARAQYFIQGKATKYWDEDMMLADPVIAPAFNALRGLEVLGTKIGVLSARTLELNLQITEAWLQKQTIKPTYIWLKPEAYSYMKPEEFKCMQIADILSRRNFSDVVFYENDPAVVDYINARLSGEHAQWVNWMEKTE